MTGPVGSREHDGSDDRHSGDGHCDSESCITCSDRAVTVTVTEMRGGGLALVDTGRGLEEISVALVVVAVGMKVLVHAGEAIAVVGG